MTKASKLKSLLVKEFALLPAQQKANRTCLDNSYKCRLGCDRCLITFCMDRFHIDPGQLRKIVPDQNRLVFIIVCIALSVKDFCKFNASPGLVAWTVSYR